MIDQFVLDNLFHHIPGDDTKVEVYWAVTKDEDAFIMYWPDDGETLHTYRYPPDWY